jgi:hypothetical protein
MDEAILGLKKGSGKTYKDNLNYDYIATFYLTISKSYTVYQQTLPFYILSLYSSFSEILIFCY